MKNNMIVNFIGIHISFSPIKKYKYNLTFLLNIIFLLYKKRLYLEQI